MVIEPSSNYNYQIILVYFIVCFYISDQSLYVLHHFMSCNLCCLIMFVSFFIISRMSQLQSPDYQSEDPLPDFLLDYDQPLSHNSTPAPSELLNLIAYLQDTAKETSALDSLFEDFLKETDQAPSLDDLLNDDKVCPNASSLSTPEQSSPLSHLHRCPVCNKSYAEAESLTNHVIKVSFRLICSLILKGFFRCILLMVTADRFSVICVCRDSRRNTR